MKKSISLYKNVFLSYIKDYKEIIKFGDIETEKRKFHHHRNTILVDEDVDIDKILISNKFSCKKGYKSFIGYKDDEKVKPLCIMLPQISRRVKRFHETKCMFF